MNWETLKNKGNDEFHKKNYQAAISLYTDALRKILAMIYIIFNSLNYLTNNYQSTNPF